MPYRNALIFVAAIWVGIVSSVASAQQPRSDNNPAELWGIWEVPDYSGGVRYLVFLPDGWFGLQYHEGIFYGTYTADATAIRIDATMEYASVENWDHQLSYVLRGRTLSTWFEDGSKIGDFVRVRDFSPFGFMDCPDSITNRIFLGAVARVTYTDGSPSRLRAEPGLTSTIKARLDEGTPMVVTAGPVCADGYTWWRADVDGISGWVAEGEDGVAYLEPLGVIAMPELIVNEPADYVAALQDALGSLDAYIYRPGAYPYLSAVAEELISGELARDAAAISDLVEEAYVLVTDAGTASNPLQIVCMSMALSQLQIIPRRYRDDNVEFACFVFDVAEKVVMRQPVMVTVSVAVEILSEPETYIDPWLDPINEFFGSFPMTRFACWIQEEWCPLR